MTSNPERGHEASPLRTLFTREEALQKIDKIQSQVTDLNEIGHIVILMTKDEEIVTQEQKLALAAAEEWLQDKLKSVASVVQTAQADETLETAATPAEEVSPDEEARKLYQELLEQGHIEKAIAVSPEKTRFVMEFARTGSLSKEAREWVLELAGKRGEQTAASAPTPPPITEQPMEDGGTPEALSVEQQKLKELKAANPAFFADLDQSDKTNIRFLAKIEAGEELTPSSREWLADIEAMLKAGVESLNQRQAYLLWKQTHQRANQVRLLAELGRTPGLTLDQFLKRQEVFFLANAAEAVKNTAELDEVAEWVTQLLNEAKDVRFDGQPDALSRTETESNSDFLKRLFDKAFQQRQPVLVGVGLQFFEYQYQEGQKTIADGLTLLKGDEASDSYKTMMRVCEACQVADLLPQPDVEIPIVTPVGGSEGKSEPKPTSEAKEQPTSIQIDLLLRQTELFLALGYLPADIKDNQHFQNLVLAEKQKVSAWTSELRTDVAWMDGILIPGHSELKKALARSFTGQVVIDGRPFPNYYWVLDIPDFSDLTVVRLAARLAILRRLIEKPNEKKDLQIDYLQLGLNYLEKNKATFDAALGVAMGQAGGGRPVGDQVGPQTAEVKNGTTRSWNPLDLIRGKKEGVKTDTEYGLLIERAASFEEIITILHSMQEAGLRISTSGGFNLKPRDLADVVAQIAQLDPNNQEDAKKIEKKLHRLPNSRPIAIKTPVQELVNRKKRPTTT